MDHDVFCLLFHFYAGSSWELVLYQRYPTTSSGDGVANTTEFNIEISESAVKSIWRNDTHPENISETDRVGVNIEDEGSQSQNANVLFHTEDQLRKNLKPYLEPECLTMHEELCDKDCLKGYDNFGPNTIAEFF